MNILYISKLDGEGWSGPSYSVPEQIRSQKLFDNIYWINLKETNNAWNELQYYCCIGKKNKDIIKNLPKPFNAPDIVIVEQFYAFAAERIFQELYRLHIPYVIVPRGEFTAEAQRQKRIKKVLANKIFMQKFINRAIAVQYLTARELQKSRIAKERKGIVVPNGFNNSETKKHKFSEKGIVISYIGRIDFNHKGLDLLLEACTKIQGKLRESHCRLSIYGPDRDGNLENAKRYIAKNKLNDFIQFLGMVVDDEKKKVLSNTDVFIMTSRFEGLPMALIEALSYGIPCFVTTGTNMREQIEYSDSGWGADTNVDAIAKKLLTMIQEKAYFKQKGENAFKLAKKYDWKDIAEQSHIKYEELLRRQE